MIKKFLTVTFFLGSFLSANVTISNSVSIPSGIEQLTNNSLVKSSRKSINNLKTYKDYLEFKKNLEKIVVFEPAKGYFLLGSLYFTEFKFRDKTIKPNINKALVYFYRSYENGNKLAAYFIALIEYKKGNVYKALNILEKALKSFNNRTDKNPVYALLAKEYATFVLDNMRNDKNALNRAIKFLENVNAKDKVAAYLLANLYYFYGPNYLKIADKLLNYACNTSDAQLKKVCDENPYIKGNEIKINCPILKRQEK